MTQTLRVLIVEDSEDDAQLLVRELRRGGYHPVFERVDSPKDMEKALDDGGWDLVLADYKLPAFNAPAALALLQKRKLDLPFIIVSGAIGEETAVEAMRIGAHDYLMKDKLARLAPAVERELKEAGTRRARRASEAETRRRNRELAALNSVAEAVNASLDLDQILDQAIEKILELTGLRLGAIWILDPSAGKLSLAAHRGLPRRLRSKTEEAASIVFSIGPSHGMPVSKPMIDSQEAVEQRLADESPVWELALPLMSRGRSLGMLMVGDAQRHELTTDEETLLAAVAGLIGTAVENASLFFKVRRGRDRLQMLARRMFEAQEAERRKLANVLQDEIGQMLSQLKRALESGGSASRAPERSTPPDPLELASSLIDRVRELSLDLSPSVLDELGLLPALHSLIERFTVQSRVRVAFEHLGLDRRFPPELELGIYRIIQEALSNVARHSGATEVRVQIHGDDRRIGVIVADAGKGFDASIDQAREDTSGLTRSLERANLHGGRLTVESRPGAGTVFTAEFPLQGTLERRLRPRPT